MRLVRISLILTMLACAYTGFAADTTSSAYPAAVLVQLQSGQNRIIAMTKANDHKALELLKKDIADVNRIMVADFNDNYKGCPVYYYIDTNAELIKNKHFTGVLLNADRSVVAHPVVNKNSSNYVIAYYGYATYQPKHQDKVDSANVQVDLEARPGKGLVILNDKYEQIDNYYKQLDYDVSVFRTKKKYKSYRFISKHYDIEYFPFAAQFMRTFALHYSRRNPGSSNIKK